MSLALCMVIASAPRWRPYVGAAMAGFAIVVVYSFLELGWHYPSDVFGGFLVAATWTLLGAAALWTLEARRPERKRELSPSGDQAQFSIGEALAPTAVLVAGGLGLACVVALTRPHAVITYATAHEAFIVGAVAIALLVLTLATAATLALRRSSAAGGSRSAVAARLPQRLVAGVGGAAEDEQQVREAVQVAHHLGAALLAAGDGQPLGAAAHGPAHVQVGGRRRCRREARTTSAAPASR